MRVKRRKSRWRVSSCCLCFPFDRTEIPKCLFVDDLAWRQKLRMQRPALTQCRSGTRSSRRRVLGDKDMMERKMKCTNKSERKLAHLNRSGEERASERVNKASNAGRGRHTQRLCWIHVSCVSHSLCLCEKEPALVCRLICFTAPHLRLGTVRVRPCVCVCGWPSDQRGPAEKFPACSSGKIGNR